MRKYDVVFIFQTDPESLSAGKEEVGKEFAASGIKVLEEQDMGERDLAYEIKKASRGRYIRYLLESEPNSLQPIEKALKLRSEILKFVFFKNES